MQNPLDPNQDTSGITPDGERGDSRSAPEKSPSKESLSNKRGPGQVGSENVRRPGPSSVAARAARLAIELEGDIQEWIEEVIIQDGHEAQLSMEAFRAVLDAARKAEMALEVASSIVEERTK